MSAGILGRLVDLATGNFTDAQQQRTHANIQSWLNEKSLGQQREYQKAVADDAYDRAFQHSIKALEGIEPDPVRRAQQASLIASGASEQAVKAALASGGWKADAERKSQLDQTKDERDINTETVNRDMASNLAKWANQNNIDFNQVASARSQAILPHIPDLVASETGANLARNYVMQAGDQAKLGTIIPETMSGSRAVIQENLAKQREAETRATEARLANEAAVRGEEDIIPATTQARMSALQAQAAGNRATISGAINHQWGMEKIADVLALLAKDKRTPAEEQQLRILGTQVPIALNADKNTIPLVLPTPLGANVTTGLASILSGYSGQAPAAGINWNARPTLGAPVQRVGEFGADPTTKRSY